MGSLGRWPESPGVPQAHGCPGCGGRLTPVGSCDAVHYLCGSCHRCWRSLHGRLRVVDALGCPGCADQPKAMCIGLLQAVFPRFGPVDLTE